MSDIQSNQKEPKTLALIPEEKVRYLMASDGLDYMQAHYIAQGEQRIKDLNEEVYRNRFK